MAGAAQVPTSFGRELRVCLRCSLMKTYDQVCLFLHFSHRFDCAWSFYWQWSGKTRKFGFGMVA